MTPRTKQRSLPYCLAPGACELAGAIESWGFAVSRVAAQPDDEAVGKANMTDENPKASFRYYY